MGRLLYKILGFFLILSLVRCNLSCDTASPFYDTKSCNPTSETKPGSSPEAPIPVNTPTSTFPERIDIYGTITLEPLRMTTNQGDTFYVVDGAVVLSQVIPALDGLGVTRIDLAVPANRDKIFPKVSYPNESGCKVFTLAFKDGLSTAKESRIAFRLFAAELSGNIACRNALYQVAYSGLRAHLNNVPAIPSGLFKEVTLNLSP